MLLVDDHALVLRDVPPLLERHGGFKVLVASGIRDALAELNRSAVDVVVADWKLGKPGGPDGGHLIEAVQRWHPGCQNVLFSVDPLGAEVARSIGAAWYDKDDDLSVLIDVIRRVANRA